jgi:hypothetical protein
LRILKLVRFDKIRSKQLLGGIFIPDRPTPVRASNMTEGALEFRQSICNAPSLAHKVPALQHNGFVAR